MKSEEGVEEERVAPEEGMEVVWNFAFGSNLHPHKRSSRTSSRFLSTEPAVLKGWRLSFDLPAVPYIEPAMASIEPSLHVSTEAEDRPAEDHSTFEETDVHGVVLEMSRACFMALYQSEGGPRGAYFLQEVRVRRYRDGGEVRAYAFRTKARARAKRALLPSQRYLELIRAGARLSGLDAGYQKRLAALPYRRVPFPIPQLIRVGMTGFSSPLVGPCRSAASRARMAPAPLRLLCFLLLFPYILLSGCLYLLYLRLFHKPHLDLG